MSADETKKEEVVEEKKEEKVEETKTDDSVVLDALKKENELLKNLIAQKDNMIQTFERHFEEKKNDSEDNELYEYGK